jgi:hypothetical protein
MIRLALVLSVCLPVAAMAGSTPRTPDGHPDFRGTWNSASLTPLQRPVKLGMKEYYTEDEAAQYEKQRLTELNKDRRDGSAEEDVNRSYNELFHDRGTRVARTRRTSMVIDPPDGRIPPMTAEGMAILKTNRARFAAHAADGPEDRPLPDRCLMFSQSGPPMIPGNYNNNYQIVQTRDFVAITAEMGNQVRTIPLDGRKHLPPAISQWTGNSVGHWAGDTLVIETSNFRFNDKSRFGVQYEGGVTDQNLHITERFTLTGPDSITYRATIEDPTIYTRPWTMEAVLERTAGPLYEFACHEGNYAMMDMLSGARTQENKSPGR